MKAYNFIAVCLLILLSCKEMKTESSENVSPPSETFLYFAYGSNLLSKRIHIKNPSAQFFSIAKLPNYRLDFQMFDIRYWTGAYATIAEDSGSDVWGVLWTLDVKDIPNLDEQEGVKIGAYKVLNVTVHTPHGRTFMARSYQMPKDPPKVPAPNIPPERQPSFTYMEVILYGAFEFSLPMHYIRFLFTFPTNGKLASLNALEQLGPPFNETEAT